MADYARFLADLKTQREGISEELKELDDLIARVERMASRFRGMPLQASLITDSDRVRVLNRARQLGKMTMPEAIKVHFESLPPRAWQTTRDVQDGVMALGIKGGKNIRGHVYNTLHRLSQGDGPFKRTDKGLWGLGVWVSGGEQKS
jgi:hypothetical protein